MSAMSLVYHIIPRESRSALTIKPGRPHPCYAGVEGGIVTWWGRASWERAQFLFDRRTSKDNQLETSSSLYALDFLFAIYPGFPFHNSTKGLEADADKDSSRSYRAEKDSAVSCNMYS